MPSVFEQLADAFTQRKKALNEGKRAKSVLPGSDYFMPESSKKDLANQLSVFEQGGLPGVLKEGAKKMYENPVVNTAISLTPGAGDLQSAFETIKSAREGDWTGAGLNAVGMLPFVPALKTVWHGSPHTFDKFDMSKIGTGEGAQAYGHGLYLAEAQDVAQQYQKDLTKGGDLIGGKPINELYEKIQKQADRLPAQQAELEYEKLGFLEDIMQQSDAGAALKRIDNEDLLPWAEEIAKKWQPGGSLYKVDLPDEQIAKMLDWDKPLHEQSPEVINAMKSMTNDVISGGFDLSRANRDLTKAFNPITRDDVIKEIMAEYPNLSLQNGKLYERSGSEIPEMAITDWMRNKHGIGYEDAGQWIRDMSHVVGSQSDISATLLNNGIPGVQYLDQASRGAGDGTRNYVVFSDEIPQILERNGTLVNK